MKGLAGPALRIAVSAGLVAFVLSRIDAAEVGHRLAGANPVWLLAAIALLSAQTILMALRWRLTAARLGLRIGLGQAIGEYYLGQLVNVTLPGGVIGDAARAVRSRARAGLGTAAHAVMVERLAGQVAMAAVTLLGFGIALAVPGGIAWPGWTGAAWAAAFGLIALAVSMAAHLARSRGIVRSFAASFRAAILDGQVLPRQIVLSLTIIALNLAAFAACARATGTVLSVEAIATVIPLILTAMLVPLSVAGLGWREGAAASLFPLAGAAPDAGAAAGLAFGLVLVVASLPGLARIVIASPGRAALPSAETPR